MRTGAMDEEMEVETIYEACEVDLDYEFDAPMFFDLSRMETSSMLRFAEEWFLDAPSYPPSPFVAKLLLGEQNGWLREGIGDCNRSLQCDTGMEVVQEKECDEKSSRILSNIPSNSVAVCGQQFGVASGSSLLNLPSHNTQKSSRANIKSKFGRSSTLMKPTASMLAKQNRTLSRPRNLPGQGNETASHPAAVEIQASKRQKLEVGQLFKVGEAKAQMEFSHKAPKKNVDTDKNSVSTKLKVTVPKEPALATTTRLLKKRTEVDCKPYTVAEHGFKARPLNRKILEAPSFPLPKRSTPKLPEFHEFHLKTSERAMHHSSASSSILSHQSTKGLDKPNTFSGVQYGSRDYGRPNNARTDKCDNNFALKTRSAFKKIFSSKGQNSDVRNDRPEVPVPTEERLQLPIELFNKLSLTSEVQQNDKSRVQYPPKGPKENRLYLFGKEQKVTISDECNFSVKRIGHGGDVIGNHLTLRSLELVASSQI